MSDSKAREAHQSDIVDKIAGAGLIAYGVVHLLIGWLAVQLALGDREGGASSTGAVKQLAEQPFGKFLVWALALGLVLLVVWRLVEAALGYRDEDDPKRLFKRLLSAGKAIVYTGIAYSAISIATGSSSGGGGKGGSGGGGGSTDSMTATLMNNPGGQLLVGAIGVGIIAAGVGLLVVAYRESYLDRLDDQGLRGSSGTTYKWLGRAGHVAKGLSYMVVGGLFLYAAATHEAKKSGGLDQALRTVLEQPFGPVLLAAIGLGFAAYGLFCFATVRHLDR
ncbi:DUF1206 domain-containing protein [Nocardioides sp.]|uniref:DUF1206 domain-containing protein n=1 Tax=Nocardioides sp. TaxID=35761 RepID=UPI002B2757C4|nr:DUF1206 domain-containing protein [Nocardioides sp.]